MEIEQEITISCSTAGRARSINDFVRRLPALDTFWSPTGSDLQAAARGRAEVLGQVYALRTVPDLRADAGGQRDQLAADRCRPPCARRPDSGGRRAFGEGRDGGVFLDQDAWTSSTTCARPTRRASPAGVHHRALPRPGTSWTLLAEKATCRQPQRRGRHAVPAAPPPGPGGGDDDLGRGSAGAGYGEDYRPRTDLVAWAERDLPAGTLLTAEKRASPQDRACRRPHGAGRLGDDTPIARLAANHRLQRPVAAGSPIRCADVAVDPKSVLLRLRQRQDAMFRSSSHGREIQDPSRRRAREPARRRGAHSTPDAARRGAEPGPRHDHRGAACLPGAHQRGTDRGAAGRIAYLREAIKSLASEGLVENVPSRRQMCSASASRICARSWTC